MSAVVPGSSPFGGGRSAGPFVVRLVPAVLVLAACAGTAQPPPALPPPVPEASPAAAPAAAAPREYVRVTGSKLNVREAPRASARTTAKLARGTRVEKRGVEGEWVEVVLADGTTGWVSARYVAVDAPCLPESIEPEVLSAPPVGFASDGPHGRVVLEATVSRSGEVAAVKIKENTTGSAEQARTAGSELQQMRFKPFIRGCKAVPFIYVFTRTY